MRTKVAECAHPPRHKRLSRFLSAPPVPPGGGLSLDAEDSHRFFTHFYLADLPGDRQRELVGDVHVAGNLVVRQPARAELAQLRGGAGCHRFLPPLRTIYHTSESIAFRRVLASLFPGSRVIICSCRSRAHP